MYSLYFKNSKLMCIYNTITKKNARKILKQDRHSKQTSVKYLNQDLPLTGRTASIADNGFEIFKATDIPDMVPGAVPGQHTLFSFSGQRSFRTTPTASRIEPIILPTAPIL